MHRRRAIRHETEPEQDGAVETTGGMLYSEIADVVLLPVEGGGADLGGCRFVEVGACLVVRQGVVIGVILPHASRMLSGETLQRCGGLDALAVPRLSAETG